MERVKHAIKRDPNAPIGQPATLYLDCRCGLILCVDYPDGPEVSCGACGARYTADGWRVR